LPFTCNYNPFDLTTAIQFQVRPPAAIPLRDGGTWRCEPVRPLGPAAGHILPWGATDDAIQSECDAVKRVPRQLHNYRWRVLSHRDPILLRIYNVETAKIKRSHLYLLAAKQRKTIASGRFMLTFPIRNHNQIDDLSRNYEAKYYT